MSRSQPTDGFNPKPGFAEMIAPGIRRILAPNPSPMTYRGTNTYLIGTRNLAVIDPGPSSEPHLEAILSNLKVSESIDAILVTHSHLDHSPLAKRLQEETGAAIYAFGPAGAGRSAIMETLAQEDVAGGGEGIDHAFRCDHVLKDGETLSGPDWQIEALHTPGHLGNHLCFALGDVLFSGDHVMGWASSLVSPPDGDLTDFMNSCRKLQDRQWSRFLPGHGAPIDAPHARLDWLIAHRLERERAILAELRIAPRTVSELAATIYKETPAALLEAAERNVFAHLVDLTQRNIAQPEGALTLSTRFSCTD